MATQITPAKVLPITKQIQDTLNGGTFYVRAIIKIANTRETIDTVNLTDAGSGYFYYNWTVPYYQDETYVDILVTTYDDSGYTTINGIYGTEKFQYVIRDPRATVGGGFGMEIDYKKVRQIIKEELEMIPRPTPEIDLVPLFNRLGGLEQLIKENKPKNPDYSGILSSINEIKSTLIKEISKNKPEKMDLSGIESKINGMEGKIGDKFEKFAKEVVKDLVEAVDRIPDNLKDFSKNLKFTAVFPVALEKEQDDPEKKRLEEIKKKYNLK